MASNHTALLNMTMLKLQGMAKVWRNETGVARSFDDPSRVIRYGLKGSTDILGLTKDGCFLAIEIKYGSDKLRPDQIAFRDMIQRFNGKYFLIKNENDITEMIESLLGKV